MSEPEQNPVPEHRVEDFESIVMDRDLVKRFMNKVYDTASSVLEFTLQWEDHEKEMELIENSIAERLTVLEEKENNSDLKQFLEASVMMLVLEMQNEEVVTQFQAQEKLFQDSMIKKREELDARKNELSVLNETIKEKSTELEAEAREIEVKSKLLELKQKKLEEMEEQLALKQRELEEAETLKRSRLEFEPTLLAQKLTVTDADSLIRPGKKHKPIREFQEPYNETDSACVLYGKTSSCEFFSTNEDTEPFSCPNPDFNDFNNTMSSFALGQVWALYDPLDDMPRYYAQITTILRPQLSVQVTWLEPEQTTENEKPIPACGRFKYGDSETQSLLMFSHQMQYIIRGKHVIINPRKGETWALFRDWTKTCNSNWKQHKASYRYDFVKVLLKFDRDQGIGVAYLGKVEGFTSVYKAGEQHGLIEVMIAPDEMLRFSHRVPSFKLTGNEEKRVPDGSMQLDPAAIPRAYLKGDKVTEEKIRP